MSFRFSRSAAGAALLCGTWMLAAASGASPKFFPDDPIAEDNDRVIDVQKSRQVELSGYYDFVENTFADRGDRRDIRALNVNTIDEVPDSSWFTNRLGHRAMTLEEIVRGPDREDIKLSDAWIVTRGKSGGFQPGFRAVNADDPSGQLYQIEFDPPSNPEMATSAEMIGTVLYYAMGYNVVDVHFVEVDPAKLTIKDTATQKRASGTRKFLQSDLDLVLNNAARLPNGNYRALASRFVEGEDMGPFRYYGTRPDDPNDIYPHEHRRELRANRVFAVWVNHDDSRAVNSLDMLVTRDGKKHFLHYMFDFGSIFGSATRFADTPTSGREYLIEKQPSLLTMATLGLYVRPALRQPHPHNLPKAAGTFTAEEFDPITWRAEYPNPAFVNMRADDAFWGARILAAFTDEIIRAAVAKGRYTDPAAAQHVADTLIKRRDTALKVWLNGVNPVVSFSLSPDGVMTFDNAAVTAGAATAPPRYGVQWSRFDNATAAHTPVGQEMDATTGRVQAPAEALSGEFVSASVTATHPDHPVWSRPVQVYFRREAGGWKLVGLERDVPPRDPQSQTKAAKP